MSKGKKILLNVILLVLLGVLLFSGYQLWKIYSDIQKETEVHTEQMHFKPTVALPTSEATDTEEVQEPMTVADLQAQYPDAVGWLTMDGTAIDYPFVQAADNDKYLRHDMDLNYLVSGTVFMDCRSKADFSDFSTVIYGHNMKSGSMFGTLEKYRDTDFFSTFSTGAIYLNGRILHLRVVAAMLVNADDATIYRQGDLNDTEKQALLDYIRQNAILYRADANVGVTDRLVLLSTCAYDYEEARMVVVAKIESDVAE